MKKLPRRVASLGGVRVLAIAAGTEHSLVLVDGDVATTAAASSTPRRRLGVDDA